MDSVAPQARLRANDEHLSPDFDLLEIIREAVQLHRRLNEESQELVRWITGSVGAALARVEECEFRLASYQ